MFSVNFLAKAGNKRLSPVLMFVEMRMKCLVSRPALGLDQVMWNNSIGWVYPYFARLTADSLILIRGF